MRAQTRIFDPKIVTAWFATFLILFLTFVVLGFFVTALLTVVIFSSIFFAAYHLYMMLPGRREENEEFLREWRKHLEERWAARPPVVRSVDYYMRAAPFDPRAAIGLLIALVLLLVLIAIVSPFLEALFGSLI